MHVCTLSLQHLGRIRLDYVINCIFIEAVFVKQGTLAAVLVGTQKKSLKSF